MATNVHLNTLKKILPILSPKEKKRQLKNEINMRHYDYRRNAHAIHVYLIDACTLCFPNKKSKFDPKLALGGETRRRNI